MKKAITLFVASLMMVLSAIPIFAADSKTRPIVQDINITEEEMMALEHVTGIYDASEPGSKASGLILGGKLSLAKSGNNLIFTATTLGSTEVTKSGFTYVRLQRYINGGWSNYTSYVDQYSNSPTHSISKSVAAPKGYTYRVICEHYAEKPYLVIFKSTEKIYNVTATLSF